MALSVLLYQTRQAGAYVHPARCRSTAFVKLEAGTLELWVRLWLPSCVLLSKKTAQIISGAKMFMPVFVQKVPPVRAA